MVAQTGAEHRQHPRFRVALRVHLQLPTGHVVTPSIGVSRAGMSVRLSPAPAIGESVAVTVELPNGTSIDGRALVKSTLPGCLCGLLLSFSGHDQAHWDAFIDEEESTGSLWRMIGRSARAPDDAQAARGVTTHDGDAQLRFHTVGENGEAYRLAFKKHPSDAGEDCDLARTLPGFREQARRLVLRVLRTALALRFDDAGKVYCVRVCELLRGGYGYVQGPGLSGSDADAPVGVVSLGVGELVLIERNGVAVFPSFSPDELEQIACDTFRRELQRPVFVTPPRGVPDPRPAPVALPRVPAPEQPDRFRVGIDAVRFAQAASEDVQMRRYGERDIWFHPSVWARVTDGAHELMGPTLQDGARVCVLALVGHGAPRVVRLDDTSAVSLLKPPARK